MPLLALLVVLSNSVPAKSQNQYNAVSVIDSVVIFDGSVATSDWSFGGIARSTDYGKSWSGIGSIPASFVYKLQRSGADVYACMSGGLYESTDAGATWQLIGFEGYEVRDVKTYGDTILAVANGTLFRSTDRGANWETLLPWDSSRNFHCILQQAGIIYAGQSLYNAGGIFRSTDGGKSWNQFCLSDVVVNELCVAGNNLLAGSVAPEDGILMSTDNGANWNEVLSYSQTYMVTGFEKTSGAVYASSRNGVFRYR